MAYRSKTSREPRAKTTATGALPPERRTAAPTRKRGRQTSRLLTRVFILAVAVALVIGVFALVRASTASLPAASSGTSSTGASTTHASSLAPDFTLVTLGGGSFQLAAQRGHIVVLYFMAPTCPSCVQGSRDLAQALLSARTPGAEALAIDLNPGDTATDLQAFVKSVGAPAQAPIRWGLDTNGSIASAYGVQVLEATVVINAQGQVAYQNNGPVPPDQLAQIVRNLA